MSESLRNSGRIWVPKKLKIQLPSEKERKKILKKKTEITIWKEDILHSVT
jgi:SpoVK/Ycf46/Vps4 family AAA+-type ATPase